MLARRAAVAVAMILGLVAAGCGTARQMPNPNGTGPALKTLVFYDQGAEPPGGGNIQPLVAANRSAIAVLAPDWYKVMPDGSLRDLSTNALKTFATKENIKLTPLVVNYNGTSSFLLNATARNKAVNALATMLKNHPSYAGLNIDFELLKPSARSGLVLFMQALYGKTQALHKTLTIDVIPAGSRRQASQAYNFPKLAQSATDIVLMTYDAHDDGSAPGPVAPLNWVRARVNLALTLGVPANRLIVGLADYGYDWSAGSTKAATLSLAQIRSLVTKYHVPIQRMSDGTPHFTYTANGVKHIVYYEDGVAIQPIIRFARSKGVAGLALWMAGYENAAYWSALRSAAGTGPAVTPTGPQVSKTSTTGKKPSTTGKTKTSGTTTTNKTGKSSGTTKGTLGTSNTKKSGTSNTKKSGTSSTKKTSKSTAPSGPSGTKSKTA